MKNQRLKLNLTVFVIGLLGVFSLLTIQLPESIIPTEIKEQFSPTILKLMTLANPLILLTVFTFIGTRLHEKVQLDVPLIKAWLNKQSVLPAAKSSFKSGIIGGLLAGASIITVAAIFYPYLPFDFIEFGRQLQLTPIARLLYGGLTEEILLRFGMMTLIIWIAYKISGSLSRSIYWIGIVLAALLFAAGHLPIASVATAHPSMLLTAYILIGNMLGGLIFGWLYWKKGLESAFVAHMTAHIVMMAGEMILNIG